MQKCQKKVSSVFTTACRMQKMQSACLTGQFPNQTSLDRRPRYAKRERSARLRERGRCCQGRSQYGWVGRRDFWIAGRCGVHLGPRLRALARGRILCRNIARKHSGRRGSRNSGRRIAGRFGWVGRFQTAHPQVRGTLEKRQVSADSAMATRKKWHAPTPSCKVAGRPI